MVLLIAMPRSSSTSALRSLGTVSGHPNRQEYPCWMRPAKHRFNESSMYYHLSLFHHDICQMSSIELRRWMTPSTIFKQHLVPTPHNVELVTHHLHSSRGQRRRALVLLRDPVSSMRAACERVVMEKTGCATRSLNRAQRGACVAAAVRNVTSLATLAALRDFASSWRRAALSHNDSILVLTYEQLALHGRERTLLAALDWLGLPRNRSFEDSRLRTVNRSSALCGARVRAALAAETPSHSSAMGSRTGEGTSAYAAAGGGTLRPYASWR